MQSRTSKRKFTETKKIGKMKIPDTMMLSLCFDVQFFIGISNRWTVMYGCRSSMMDWLFVQFITAMTRPTSNSNDVPGRLKRHFAVVHCASPDAQLLDHVFKATASSYFSDELDFTAEVQQVVVRLVPLTRRIWHTTKVACRFCFVIAYFFCVDPHYAFSV